VSHGALGQEPDLRDRRDEAIVRLLTEAGMPPDEVIGHGLADFDLEAGAAIVRRGMRGRVAADGPHPAGSPDPVPSGRRHRATAEAILLALRCASLSRSGQRQGYVGCRGAVQAERGPLGFAFAARPPTSG
jgi:integrase